jgi:hypothetical protein
MNTIGWLYGKMINYSPLVTALGSANKILRAYPNTVNDLPVLAFMEANNRNESFYDNRPLADSESVDIHIFTAFDVPTSSLSDTVSALMASLLFTRDYQADQDDPSTKVRHKILKFSRDNIVAQDLN